MRKDRWTDERLCPECEAPLNVAFYPGCKGNTYGRPEDCYPPEGADLDYEFPECKSCGYEFTDKDVDRWIEEIEGERNERSDRY